MGVMSCSRPDCDNILCDTYINEIGYVCYECQKEFKDYLKRVGSNPSTDREIKSALKVFMDTEKHNFTHGEDVDIDEFFRKNDLDNEE